VLKNRKSKKIPLKKKYKEEFEIGYLRVEEFNVVPPLAVLHEPVGVAEEAGEPPFDLQTGDEVALAASSYQVSLKKRTRLIYC
jgi:hypothetical protein